MFPESMADDALMRMSHLTNRDGKPGVTGMSRTSLYRLIESGNFPKPIRPLPGIVAWRAGDIRQWLQDQAQRAACTSASAKAKA